MKPTPTPDVINLVVAAREFWDANNDFSVESRALDKALEPFSSLVPYENEPHDAALSVPAEAVVGEPVAVPVPRGGLEPNWWEEWQKIVRKYRRLEKAARFVVSETDRIHDNEPWPLKYHAPYEAITQLRDVLDVVPSAPDGWQPIDTAPKDGTKILVWSGFWDKHHLVRWNQGENAWCEGSWCFGSVPDMVWMPLPTPPALGGSHE